MADNSFGFALPFLKCRHCNLLYLKLTHPFSILDNPEMMAVALKLLAVWFVVFCTVYVYCGAGGSLSKEMPVVEESVESALTFELTAER